MSKATEYNRKYRAAHRVRVRRLSRISSARFFAKRRLWFAELKDHPCKDCGRKYPPYVMDWDHVRGRKLFSIGSSRMYSRARLLREIAKCDLVCANCHRIRTHKGD